MRDLLLKPFPIQEGVERPSEKTGNDDDHNQSSYRHDRRPTAQGCGPQRPRFVPLEAHLGVALRDVVRPVLTSRRFSHSIILVTNALA